MFLDCPLWIAYPQFLYIYGDYNVGFYILYLVYDAVNTCVCWTSFTGDGQSVREV